VFVHVGINVQGSLPTNPNSQCPFMPGCRVWRLGLVGRKQSAEVMMNPSRVHHCIVRVGCEVHITDPPTPIPTEHRIKSSQPNDWQALQVPQRHAPATVSTEPVEIKVSFRPRGVLLATRSRCPRLRHHYADLRNRQHRSRWAVIEV
jgi:hypothetical protein